MYALVIDDSRAMRRITGKIMKKLGFEILEACHGLEGITQLEKHADEIGVALVDWNMPEMNGIEFVEYVRARDCYADQKLVMVTTETEPVRMARAIMSGVDEFVMKPFTEDILVEKLQLIGVSLNMSSS